MILATNNIGKLKEIREILKEYVISSLKDKNIDIDVIENQDTFVGNAKKKALEIYDITHEEVLADDSGLCIEALNGFPGVMTHRFLGENATDEERNQYLIDEVNKHENRNASVVCSLVYYDGVDFTIGTGEIKGVIAKEMRGTNGFGFDPIFELPNGLTLAETSSEEKNAISARAMAARDLQKKLTR